MTPSPATCMEFDLGRAICEADRCLLCHDAPCSRGCPAGTDPGRFIRKLRMRNLTGAIRTIKRNNPLGGSCATLCPTARLCEKACCASGLDRPIRIGELQRFLVSHGQRIGFDPIPRPEPRAQKVAVVGSGPAGLTCAAELARQGYPVTVFERMPHPGGMMRYGVPTHRFDPAMLEREVAEIVALGVQIRCSSPVEGDGAVQALLRQGYEAVFLAPGAWASVPLREGQSPPRGVVAALELLRRVREGEPAGADVEAMVRGKTVAVIGGGSVAIDAAESALRLGASDVTIVYRRSYREMPAEEDEKLEALRAGVHLLSLVRPVDYALDATGALRGLKLVRTRLGEPDGSGRRRPIDVPGSEWTLDVDVVIEAIGQAPEAGSARACPEVRLSDGRLVQIDEETGRTSVDGLYAGGDVVRGPALIIQAIHDGKRAARAIAARLSGGAR